MAALEAHYNHGARKPSVGQPEQSGSRVEPGETSP